MAVARLKTGEMELLPEGKFEKFCKNIQSNSSSLYALQPHVQPKHGDRGGSFYRNELAVDLENGRVTSATFKVPKWSPDSVEPTANNRKLMKSRASVLNARLNAMSTRLLRYIESSAGCRILTISAEYILDEADDIWLAWVDNVDMVPVSKYRHGDALQSSSNLKEGFLQGDSRAKALRAQLNDAVRKTEAIESMQQGELRNFNSRNREDGDSAWAIPSPNQSFEEKQTKTRKIAFSVVQDRAETESKHYPTPFQCHGDFCSFKVATTESSKNEYENNNDLGSLLEDHFSREDQDTLLRKGLMENLDLNDLQQQQSKDETSMFRITYKSIELARKENDKRMKAIEHGDEEDNYSETSSVSLDSRATGVRRTTASQRMKKRFNRRKVGGGGGPANWYKEVRVCNRCYSVYRTLDAARTMLKEVQFLKKSEKGIRKRARNMLARSSSSMGERVTTPSHETKHEIMHRPATIGATRHKSQNTKKSGKAHLSKSASERIILPELKRHAKETSSRNDEEVLLKLNGTNPQQAFMGETTYTKRLQTMPWKEKGESKEDIKKILQERAAQQSLGREGNAMRQFGALDSYIRNDPKPKKKRKEAVEEAIEAKVEMFENTIEKDDKVARILIADENMPTREAAGQILHDEGFYVVDADTGIRALEISRDEHFDVILISRDLDGLNGIEVTKMIRTREAEEMKKIREAKKFKVATSSEEVNIHIPIIAYTDFVTPNHLRAYMEAGMDGCVSKPVKKKALLDTVLTALPKRLRDIYSIPFLQRSRALRQQSLAKVPGSQQQVMNTRPSSTSLNVDSREGKKKQLSFRQRNSSDIVKGTLVLPIAGVNDATTGGVFQMDADTAIPYTIIGSRNVKEGEDGPPVFSFIFLNDIFDTCETYQIFLRSLVSKYHGVQVLIFNYPGQAFSEWRKDVLLNNKYLAGCLDALLKYVGPAGTGEFVLKCPLYLCGFGFGASVAMYYALEYATRGPLSMSLRAVLSLNGFSHVGPHLAGVLHDCMNVFSVSPPTRPDIPVYFWTRFLFSGSYLSRVKAPLALNLYTAVHNPISIAGRMQLCKGMLGNVDLRQLLPDLKYPLILVHASQNSLVKPLYVQSIVESRGYGQVRSIKRCLDDRKKVCVLWMRAGHELFQECRKVVMNLFEQLATGYHEKYDVGFREAPRDGSTVLRPSNSAAPGSMTAGSLIGATESVFGGSKPGLAPIKNIQGKPTTSGGTGAESSEMPEYFEDRFIDNILGSLHRVREEGFADKNPFLGDEKSQRAARYQEAKKESDRWRQYQNESATSLKPKNQQMTRRTMNNSPPRREEIATEKQPGFSKLSLVDSRTLEKKSKGRMTGTLDPTNPSFERRDNLIYKSDNGSKIYSEAFPEVKEYMRWRVARNQKRLQKLTRAANCIQRGFRSYLARNLVRRMKMQKAALMVQKQFRSKMARDIVKWKKKEIWASSLVQRNWRGKAGREIFLQKRAERAAASFVQRIYRGRLSRKRVQNINHRRMKAAQLVQSIWRSKVAREYAYMVRNQRQASINIQRVWRGHLAMRRAKMERDRYLFSKAQSQGIEFGRQMLLEHKLHGTRLQSEVSLLTREKLETEEKVEGLLKEISEFEEGVRQLERDMHQLSSVETNAVGVLDQEGQVQLREEKARLDNKFRDMLQKISDRKDLLAGLESKLQTLDRHRQAKDEELRDLERKLVVLLEEQQKELELIKKRQQKRGELFISDDLQTGAKLAGDFGPAGKEIQSALQQQMSGSGHGPTQAQQQQARALMQSTETLMKFGFLSMSLTYFSSLNMVRAMKATGALETLMAAGEEHGMKALANSSTIGTSESFQPALKPGKFPGQEDMRVKSWSVNDVGAWLETLNLKQYKEAFADAAVDGAFLYDLDNEDLQNTLGIDHTLHRKKILNAILRLQQKEQELLIGQQGLSALSSAGVQQAVAVSTGQSIIQPTNNRSTTIIQQPIQQFAGTTIQSSISQPQAAAQQQQQQQPDLLSNVKLADLFSWVRNGRYKNFKEALSSLPQRRFDPSNVEFQYVTDVGTVYKEEYDRLRFHINKVDDNGNTLFLIACQNGQERFAKFLLNVGANQNHQNSMGNTPLHFAMSYQFFDLGTWLCDPEEGAGCDDR
eukprot:g2301.t1